MQPDDDISIIDLVDFFLSHWLALLGCGLGGGLAGLLIALAMPSQFEVTLPIQISQVGDLGRVESPAVVIERIKSGGFAKRIERDLGEATVKASIKVDPIKGTELVLLKTRADSASKAQQISLAYLQALEAIHREAAEPYRQRIQGYIGELKREQQRARLVRDEMVKVLTQSMTKSDGALLLRSNVISLQDNYLQSLSQRILLLEASMDPSKNFDTRAFVEAELNEEQPPVFPSPAVFASMGLLAGGFIAFLVLLIRRSWKMRLSDSARLEPSAQ